MTVHVARDGEELGMCEETELEQLARDGEIQPGDHYWHDGMGDWKLLSELLPARAWEPTPAIASVEQVEAPQVFLEEKTVVVEPEPEPESKLEPESQAQVVGVPEEPADKTRLTKKPRRSLQKLVACLLASLIAAGALVHYKHNRRPQVKQSYQPAAPTVAPSPTKLADTDQIRNEALADLRQRLNRLPERAQPPLYTFYYDIAVDLTPSAAPGTVWSAVIHGGENIVDPATNETSKRTDFVINTDYRDGAWVFRHYRGTTIDAFDSAEAVAEHDEGTSMPPSLVGILGLKMISPAIPNESK